MRCLAVLKQARITRYFERQLDKDADPMRVDMDICFGTAFPSQRAFNEAAIALVRFGFMYMASAWGAIALSITPRGLAYIDNLDLDCLEQM